MEVVNYLKENGIGQLVSEFAIKVKEYPEEGLLVLNYDQINSPKAHPIVMECRSLILDYNFNVVSRSFDRFFNIGEQPDTQSHIDWNKAVCYDKIDGSLIKLYNYRGVWYVATRGMAFAESNVGMFDLTFKQLVFKALNVDTEENFQKLCNNHLWDDLTYICEVTSFENRVVRHYKDYKLHYLASRCNKDFEYEDESLSAQQFGMIIPNKYVFTDETLCVQKASQLKDLDEGYVLYQDGVPVCKIKSPAYVAVHHLRGEGLNPKRICELVLTNEQEEYLKYFPEDREYVDPYTQALVQLKQLINEARNQFGSIENQKDFALSVKDFPFSAILFQVKKSKKTVEEVFSEQRDSYKIELLQEFKEKVF